MKVSILTVAFATMTEAAFHERRQFGNPDVSDCGLDAFEGHTSEALLFCSNILKSGTATATITNGYTTTTTTTVKTTVTVQPSATPKPTPTPTPTPTILSYILFDFSTIFIISSDFLFDFSILLFNSVFLDSCLVKSTVINSCFLNSCLFNSRFLNPSLLNHRIINPRLIPNHIHAPTTTPSCGVAGYVKVTPAYYFESSGTKNTFAACSELCKADSKCKSFGFGEANCMLFDVTVSENTNLNPTSPYTFYDATCGTALKRSPQLNISLGLPGGGINISLGLGPSAISSACSCLITRGPASTTVTRTVSSGVTRTATLVSSVTTTVGAPRGAAAAAAAYM
ncbi:uncharacterized protein SETTUDRAFT_24037 [Exserohilum turcica Et28A]|uniref:Apple domain-containing protein n=1 Tax=Exserohilum turcicum (strain 28A) TaxID=671987 RepID=R0JVZ7_EXST2|nr:uncharacterized protein SETTUDRAFT_24037 [Exserohilum turcica Et28A]EOA81649.1 hypothetical protein SETTUDRAFT_24037 [Exserohilum turcica Et28A]